MKRYFVLPFVLIIIFIIVIKVNNEIYHNMYLTCLDGSIKVIYHNDQDPHRRVLDQLCNAHEQMLVNDIEQINNADLDVPVNISELTYELLNIAKVAYLDTESRFNIGNGHLMEHADQDRQFLMQNNYNNLASLEVADQVVTKTENLTLNLHNLKSSFIIYQLSMKLAELSVTDFAIINNNLMLAKGAVTNNYPEYPISNNIIARVSKTNQDLMINQFSFKPLNNVSSVTVISNDIIKAEIIATTLLYDNPRSIINLVKNIPYTEVIVKDNDLKRHQSFTKGD